MTKLKIKKNETSRVVSLDIGDIKVRGINLFDIAEDELILEGLSYILDCIEDDKSGEYIMDFIFKSFPIVAYRLIARCTNLNKDYESNIDELIPVFDVLKLLNTIFELTITNREVALQETERFKNNILSVKGLIEKNKDILDNDSAGVEEIDFDRLKPMFND